MTQLENIETIEKRLWASADTLRANSNYASNEYFMPVMGLIFLRHAYSRYLMVRDQIEASMPTRAGKTRPLTKEDFSRKSAIYLKPEAQFDYIVELPDSADRAQAMITAMESIESDYENLRGVLPKTEYQELDNAVLGQLLRTFNDPALKNASGDIFGRIYEYFLTGFADQKAHHGGEFLTPVSLVQMIVYVIEPNHGKILDIAISYFYSYLNEHGRAGFVMSSQASSAGGGEAKVRQKLIETGHVDMMMSNVYRKVTRKIYDFSPEQRKNLTSIVWLYRGQEERFLKLVEEYLDTTITEAEKSAAPVEGFIQKLANLLEKLEPFLKKLPEGAAHAETLKELRGARTTFINDNTVYKKALDDVAVAWKSSLRDNAGLRQSAETVAPLSEQSRDLVRQVDLLFKLVSRLIDICENELKAKGSEHWVSRETSSGKKALDESRKEAVEQLKKVHYFHKQAHWLQERFPEAKLRDVEGLVKLVDRKELEANDWSLTPGRYVGVVPEVEDEDFDFEEALRDIHVELQDLNTEAVELAGTIARNFEELGV
jgi:type I restriction-modification system DNA methylase subunit